MQILTNYSNSNILAVRMWAAACLLLTLENEETKIQITGGFFSVFVCVSISKK